MNERPFHSYLRIERAFSLVELLVVMAIIALLIGLSVPSINSSLRASHLSGAGQSIVDQLNFARQTAISRNLPVEVRFYKLPDYDQVPNGAPKVYRGFQSFVLEDTNAMPLVRPQYFAAPVVCSSSPTESPLLDAATLPENTPAAGDRIPTYGVNYAYRSFLFKPSGATSLTNANVFLTLVLENDKPIQAGGSFCTIQIDPLSGRPTTFRP